jgi:uracil-DNA glycosylase family 4
MLVGEQPGDVEDRGGRAFIGPAGQLLDQALAEAGIDRAKVYVTNAVKHFKWELRGKRRIHQTPNSRDIAACRPWLEAELRLVKAARPDLSRINRRDDDLGPGVRGSCVIAVRCAHRSSRRRL